MFVIDFSSHLGKKKYPVRNLRISPDAGTLAATFGEEGEAEHVAWWSITKSQLIATTPIRPEDRDQPAEPVFTPSLSHLAVHGCAFTGLTDFVAMISPGQTVQESKELYFSESIEEPRLDALAISPDGNWLLAVHGREDEFSGISRWDLRKAMRPRNLTPESLNGHEITAGLESIALTVSPKNRWIAYGLDTEVWLFDFRTGRWMASLALPQPHPDPCCVNGLVFSPSGKWLAVRATGYVAIFNANGGTEVVRFKPTNLTDMAFTPDGKRLLTGGLDNLVRVWDTATWKEIARYDWKIGPIHSVTVSPDGLTAAAGGDKCHVVVWDLDG